MREKINDITTNKFVADLVTILKGYLNKYNLPFYLQNEKISINELLDPKEFLPIFLFDKQRLLNNIVDNINEQHNTLFCAILTFKNNSKSQDTIDLSVNIEENISSNPKYQLIYRNLLITLAKSILTQKDIYVENNKIYIDKLYSKLVQAYHSQQIIVDDDNYSSIIHDAYNTLESLDYILNLDDDKNEDNSEQEDTEHRFLTKILENSTNITTDKNSIIIRVNPEINDLILTDSLEINIKKLQELKDLKTKLMEINETYSKYYSSIPINETIIYDLEKEINTLTNLINSTN